MCDADVSCMLILYIEAEFILWKYADMDPWQACLLRYSLLTWIGAERGQRCV